MRKKLSKQLIERLPLTDKHQLIRANGQGLYLHVTPQRPDPYDPGKFIASYLWRSRYRYNGVQKSMAFGTYPEVDIHQALDAHHEACKVLRTGVDPMAQRKVERVAKQHAISASFKHVAQQWYQEKSAYAKKNDPRTVKKVRERLESKIFPHLGDLPIAKISTQQISETLKMIPSPSVADAALTSIKQIFRFAISNGHLENSPAQLIVPSETLGGKPKKKNHASIDETQLPEFLAALDGLDKPQQRLATNLMALTFVRTNELLGARWEEIDSKKHTWTIAGCDCDGACTQPRIHRMKMDRTHVIPLSKQALTILDELAAMYNGKRTGLVLPALKVLAKGSGEMGPGTFNNVLEEIGYKSVMTGHGFRRLAKTILTETRLFDKDFDVELQLAHVTGRGKNETERSYNHAEHLPSRARMMQWWADYLDDCRAGKQAARIAERHALPSNVVSIAHAAA